MKGDQESINISQWNLIWNSTIIMKTISHQLRFPYLSPSLSLSLSLFLSLSHTHTHTHTHTIHLYKSLVFLSPWGGIQCLNRTDKCKFLLTCPHWYVHAYESTGEHCLWVCPYFYSSTQHFLLVLQGRFVRWQKKQIICWEKWIFFSFLSLYLWFIYLSTNFLYIIIIIKSCC